MSESENARVVLLTGGMSIFVVANMLFNGAVWYLQYGLYPSRCSSSSGR